MISYFVIYFLLAIFSVFPRLHKFRKYWFVLCEITNSLEVFFRNFWLIFVFYLFLIVFENIQILSDANSFYLRKLCLIFNLIFCSCFIYYYFKRRASDSYFHIVISYMTYFHVPYLKNEGISLQVKAKFWFHILWFIFYCYIFQPSIKSSEVNIDLLIWN